MVNCFKENLSFVISKEQNAFVYGEFETMHFLNSCQSRYNNLMALKLDMNKVYDHVEWSFVEMMMLHMGFDCK